MVDKNLLRYDLKKNIITRDRINQEITNNLNDISDYIFIVPIKVIFYFLTMIVIFIIMFNISKPLSLVMAVSVPLGAYISYKSGDKISDFSEENISDTQNIVGYILDKHEINKSERLLEKKQMFGIERLLE